MPLNVRTFSDLNFNFTIHPVRKDVTKVTGIEAVIQSLQNLLDTNHFEVPFHPEIGSNIRKTLFENLTPVNAALLEQYINDTIRNFEPRVTISSVQVIPHFNTNGYEVNLVFFVKNISTPVTISTFLERAR
jgi:phage baseplate assembly protein W